MKTLDLDETARKNPFVDPDLLRRADKEQMEAEKMAKDLPRPTYGLSSPLAIDFRSHNVPMDVAAAEM